MEHQLSKIKGKFDGFTNEQLENLAKFNDSEFYPLLGKYFSDWYLSECEKAFDQNLVGISLDQIHYANGYRHGKQAMVTELRALSLEAKKELTKRNPT